MNPHYVITLAESEVARIEPQGAALQVVLAATTAQAFRHGQPSEAGALLGLVLEVQQAHTQGLAVLGDGLGRVRSAALQAGPQRLQSWALPWEGVAQGTLAMEFANGSHISISGSDWRLLVPNDLRFLPSMAC
ncbi:MAG: hypothetical protein C4K60_14610 [Ideonella sp. MAG2]|nr:MAG: hypothetical protein C4K60_14610 [Ideonella sp. MAG2]